LSNPKYVSEITNAKVVENDQITKNIPLIKNDESSYSSDPFDVPSGHFKIFVEGWDSIGNPIFTEFTVTVADAMPKPKNVDKIKIPNGASQVIFTAKVNKSSLKVYDSSDKEYVANSLEDDTEIVVIDNPSAGTWTVHSEDGFSYSFLKGSFAYGFSLEIPKSKEETSDEPIKGQSNSPLTTYN
jgi:hypothetical protein